MSDKGYEICLKDGTSIVILKLRIYFSFILPSLSRLTKLIYILFTITILRFFSCLLIVLSKEFLKHYKTLTEKKNLKSSNAAIKFQAIHHKIQYSTTTTTKKKMCTNGPSCKVLQVLFCTATGKS